MSRSESEQTGWEYYQENVLGSWQFGVRRGEVIVIQSIRPVHIQVIAAGLAKQWSRTVCGVNDITGEEWTVTAQEGAELLDKTIAKILEKSIGSELRAI